MTYSFKNIEMITYWIDKSFAAWLVEPATWVIGSIRFNLFKTIFYLII